MEEKLQNLSRSQLIDLALKGLEAEKLQQKNTQKLESRNQYLESENLRLQNKVG